MGRPVSRELSGRDLTRLAYVAKDGTPRAVPIAFTWNGSKIVMCTTKNAPKLPALRANPAVALTIDTEGHPPKILLIRGQAELDVVDGIPDEYLQMNGSGLPSDEPGRRFGAREGSPHGHRGSGLVRCRGRRRLRTVDPQHAAVAVAAGGR